MSDTAFGKFIPGFEFLQSLGKVAPGSSGTLPPFSHWVAPTLSIEEINKRIEELKAVQFWLDQNVKALAATVQALEVQKMTLSTLQGMNVNLSEMAKAFPFAAAMGAAPAAAGSHGEQDLSDWPLSAAGRKAKTAEAAAPQPAAQEAAATQESAAAPAAGSMAAAALQWWGALTQQFQQIAQQVMQDPEQQQAVLKATQMSTDLAKTAVKTASDMVRQAVTQTQQASQPAAASAAAQAGKPATRQAAPRKAAKPAVKKTTKAAARRPAAAKKTASRK